MWIRLFCLLPSISSFPVSDCIHCPSENAYWDKSAFDYWEDSVLVPIPCACRIPEQTTTITPTTVMTTSTPTTTPITTTAGAMTTTCTTTIFGQNPETTSVTNTMKPTVSTVLNRVHEYTITELKVKAEKKLVKSVINFLGNRGGCGENCYTIHSLG